LFCLVFRLSVTILLKLSVEIETNLKSTLDTYFLICRPPEEPKVDDDIQFNFEPEPAGPGPMDESKAGDGAKNEARCFFFDVTAHPFVLSLLV
jgi:hypothetical protein